MSTLVEDSLFYFRAFGHSDRSGAKRDGGKDVRVTVSYSPLREALEDRWSGITRRQTKGMNPAVVFIILGRHSFFVGAKMVLTIGRNSSMGVPEPFTRVISQMTPYTRMNLRTYQIL